MTTFLLFLSFLLHIITLVAVYWMIKHIQTLKQQQAPQDIHDLLEIYLEEIKQENASLKEQLNHGVKETNQNEALHDTNEQNNDYADEAKHYDVPQPDIHDTYEPSLQSKILLLYSSGYTVEAIARELNCGKSEAELMIKMHNS